MTSAERKAYDHAQYIRNRAKILARAAERRKDPGHKLYMRLYYQKRKEGKWKLKNYKNSILVDGLNIAHPQDQKKKDESSHGTIYGYLSFIAAVAIGLTIRITQQPPQILKT